MKFINVVSRCWGHFLLILFSLHRFTLLSLFKIQLKFKCTTTWKWDSLKSVKRKRVRRRGKEGIDKLQFLEVSPMSFCMKNIRADIFKTTACWNWKEPSMEARFWYSQYMHINTPNWTVKFIFMLNQLEHSTHRCQVPWNYVLYAIFNI